ncbi:hypothetical protein Q8A73_004103 [Channa argus]|nr:hypothetical protein Q8A73_004103 [Channa argus]
MKRAAVSALRLLAQVCLDTFTSPILHIALDMDLSAVQKWGKEQKQKKLLSHQSGGPPPHFSLRLYEATGAGCRPDVDDMSERRVADVPEHQLSSNASIWERGRERAGRLALKFKVTRRDCDSSPPRRGNRRKTRGETKNKGNLLTFLLPQRSIHKTPTSTQLTMKLCLHPSQVERVITPRAAVFRRVSSGAKGVLKLRTVLDKSSQGRQSLSGSLYSLHYLDEALSCRPMCPISHRLISPSPDGGEFQPLQTCTHVKAQTLPSSTELLLQRPLGLDTSGDTFPLSETTRSQLLQTSRDGFLSQTGMQRKPIACFYKSERQRAANGTAAGSSVPDKVHSGK